MKAVDVVGIDLAGSERRDTGFCAMDLHKKCMTTVIHTDEDILGLTIGAGPKVVSIDAPLFLPRGRKSLEIPGPPHFRECDKELLKMGIRFFPISLGPMRMLTARGMKLREALEAHGFEVVESFPGAAQDILGFPRKQDGLRKLEMALRGFGVKLDTQKGGYTGDELDAVTSALVGLMYLNDDCSTIGDPTEGLMILPPIRRSEEGD